MKKSLLLAGAALAVGVYAQAQKSEVPPPPPPEPPKVEVARFTPPRIVKSESYQAFLKRNPDVEKLSWQGGDKMTVIRKDKKMEKYDLSVAAEKKNFLAKYGELPVAPPPPPPVEPPPPPKPPKKG